MKLFFIILLTCFLGNISFSLGQSSLSILDVIPLIDVDTTKGLLQPPNMDKQFFNVKTYVKLSSIKDIKVLHFKIGRKLGGLDVVNVSILSDYNSLPKGVTSIEKIENNFLVNFGEHTNVYTLYLEVWAEDAKGKQTEIYRERLN